MFPGEQQAFHILVFAWLAAAGGAFVLLRFRNAPYGRFVRPGWGWRIPSRLGWMVMESPSVIVFALLFAFGTNHSPVAVVFFVIWQVHYLQRVVIYPLRLRSGASVTLFVVASAFSWQVISTYLQGRWFFAFAPAYSTAWLTDVRFIAGLAVMAAGFIINIRADSVLRSLRRGERSGYHVPQGGLYRWISCPNYFGEMVDWLGWAILTWSPMGLLMTVWTVANLLPRAVAYHRWYRQTFPDYPSTRKALIPYLL